MFSQYWSLMAWKTKQAPYWQPIQYLGWQLKFIFSCIGDSLVAILDFDIESFHFSLPDPWAHPNGFYIIYCEDCLVKAENYFMHNNFGFTFLCDNCVNEKQEPQYMYTNCCISDNLLPTLCRCFWKDSYLGHNPERTPPEVWIPTAVRCY